MTVGNKNICEGKHPAITLVSSVRVIKMLPLCSRLLRLDNYQFRVSPGNIVCACVCMLEARHYSILCNITKNFENGKEVHNPHNVGETLLFLLGFFLD